MKLRSYLRYALIESRNARGKLSFILFSIAVGVASVTAVRTMIVSLEDGIHSQARTLLGADIAVFSQNKSFTELKELPEWMEELESQSLASVDFVEFFSMLYKEPQTAKTKTKQGDMGEKDEARTAGSTLVRIKAMDSPFPFYGDRRSDPPGQWEVFFESPEAFVIVDPDILFKLKLKVGDKVFLGKKSFRIIATLVKEDTNAINAVGLAPPIVLKKSLLEETKLLQWGSRISYRKLYKMPPDFDVVGWRAEHLAQASQANLEIRSYKEVSINVQRFLKRLADFFSIISLIVLLVCGVGVSSTLSVFMKEKRQNIAIYSSLGLQKRGVFGIYLLLASILAAIGSLMGVGVGMFFAALFSWSESYQDILLYLPFAWDIQFSWQAVFFGLASGFFSVLLCALAPIYGLKEIAPLEILRQHENSESIKTDKKLSKLFRDFLLCSLAFALFLCLAFIQLRSLQTAFYFCFFVVVSYLTLMSLAWLLMRLVPYVLPYIPSYLVRQGLANLYRPNNQTTLTLSSLGAGIVLLSSIFIAEASYQQELHFDEEKKPNHFVMDVQPWQHEDVLAMLKKRGASSIRLDPMLTARIAAINGKTIEKASKEINPVRQSWSDRLRQREHFIAYRTKLLPSERLYKGRFWEGELQEPELSLDRRWAAEMNVGLGDRILLHIENLALEAKITSLRHVRWQSMQPNSMLLLSPNQKTAEAPFIYFGTYHIQGQKERLELQDALVRKYPNLSFVNLTETLSIVEDIMESISYAIRALAGFALFNGFLLIIGGVFAKRYLRIKEAMLLKTLGARQKDIGVILLAEYAFLAAAAFACAWPLTELLAYFLVDSFLGTLPTIHYGAVGVLFLCILLLHVFLSMLVRKDIKQKEAMHIFRL